MSPGFGRGLARSAGMSHHCSHRRWEAIIGRATDGTICCAQRALDVRVRAILTAGVLALLALTALVPPVKHWLEVALEWSAARPAAASLPFIALYVVATVSLLPVSILTIAAGAVFGLVRGVVLVSIGSTLGATAAFLLGRTLARQWIGRRIERWPKFRALDRAIGGHGLWIVFLTRLSPAIPFNLLNYAYGITAVRTRDYIVASWIGMLPGTILYVYAGTAAANVRRVVAGHARTGWAGDTLLWLGLVAAITVVVLVTHFARRELVSELNS